MHQTGTAGGTNVLRAALILCIIQLALLPCVFGDDSLGETMSRSLQETRQLASELAIALERLRSDSARLRAVLLAETRAREALTIGADQLRQTQLEVETLEARLVALTSRIAQQEREISTFQALPAGAVDAALLDELHQAQAQVLDALEAAQQVLAEHRDLAGERLATLYTRMDLRADRERYAPAHIPHAALAERVIASLVRQAILSANQAATYDISDTASRPRARTLEFESDRAIVRANFRQTDLDMLLLRDRIDTLDALAEAARAPVRVLSDARSLLIESGQWLEVQARVLDEQRTTIAVQGMALQSTMESTSPTREAAADLQLLDKLMSMQEREMAALSGRVAALSTRLDLAMERSLSRGLISRRAVPFSAPGWIRAAAGLSRLPEAAATELGGGARSLQTQIAHSNATDWIVVICAGLVLVVLVGIVRRLIPRLAPNPKDGLLEAALYAVNPVLWWLIPVGIWIVATVAFKLPVNPAQPVLLVLVTYPLCRFSLGLLNSIFLQDDGAIVSSEPRLRSWSRSLVALGMLASVLAATAHWLVLPPATTATVDALSMLTIIAAAIFGLKFAGLASGSSEPVHARNVARLIGATSCFAAVMAVIGLAGYSHFAWTLFRHVAWLLGLGGLLWMALGVISRFSSTPPGLVHAVHLTSVGRWSYGLTRPALGALAGVLCIGALYLYVRAISWGTPSPLLAWVLDATGLRDFDIKSTLDTPLGSSILAAAAEILVALLLAFVIWEAIKRSMSRYLPDDEDDAVAPGEDMGGTGASRIVTLMPLIQKFLLIALVAITIMVVLSAVGINIGPLLAGAGVVGLALGFGAQTLVRDIISGIFFLTDDAFRKGEYIDLGEVKGTVERISVRSLQLRHHNGPIHTVPYGEIQHVTNYSRDWAIMKFELRVPFETDLEKVRKIIKKVGIRLMDDEEVGPLLLQPLKSQGVNRMDDSALIVRCKFTSVPGQQFYVRRVAFAAIQQAFEQQGIQFAPRRVIVESGSSPGALAAPAAAAAAAAAAVAQGPGAEENNPVPDEPG